MTVAKGFSSLLARFRRSRRREEAACYSYNDTLFFCAISEVRDGPGVEWKPFCRLTSADSDDAIGTALTQVLDGSGRVLDLNDTSELRDARKEQLRAAGFSSERDLMKRAVLCHTERLPNSVRFIPTHNGGNRGETKGFHRLEDIAITIDFQATESKLGTALRAALRSCTGITDAPASARMDPLTNTDSWALLREAVDNYPGDGWQEWKRIATDILEMLESKGFSNHFRAGQSMHHLIFSTLDSHGLEDEPRVTIDIDGSAGTTRIAYARTNLHFAAPQDEHNVPHDQSAAIIVEHLERLWTETRPQEPIPDVFCAT
jgi:hypothetical protein